MDTCAASLQAHRGRGLVIAGRDQAPAVHAMAHWLNQELGNAGSTVTYHETVLRPSAPLVDSLADLTAAMDAGEVESLIMIDSNPVFDAPADFGFAESLGKVELAFHMGLYFDETAAASQWHLPLLQQLESWGDARSYNGTMAIRQPLIRPLYGSLSAYSLLAFIEGGSWLRDYDAVRGYWREQWKDRFEERWRDILITGFQEDSAAPVVRPSLQDNLLQALSVREAGHDGVVLQLKPDSRVRDGTYANNAWLQELPHPLTKITWGNALLMSPALAQRLSIAQGDIVEIDCGNTRVEVPAYPITGHAENAVTLHFGYGGKVAADQSEPTISQGIGVNVYPLRQSGNLSIRHDVRLRKTGEHSELALTQHHADMGRP